MWLTDGFLGFDDDTLSKLPKEGDARDNPFLAILLDAETGREYEVKHDWAAYQGCEWFCDKANDVVSGWSLMAYFYKSHWCGCHRIDSIEWSNPGVTIEHSDGDVDVDNDGNYCPRKRFRVVKMWHPDLPDLILLRETVARNGK